MNHETASHFLSDFGHLLWELADEPRVEREASADDQDRAFAAGRTMGLYSAVSLLRSQADVFGLSPSQVGLPEAPPEELL